MVSAKLRTSTYMDDSAAYLASALAGSLLISAYSVIGFFDLPSAIRLTTPLWVGLFVYASLAFWRVSRIMLLLLRIDPDTL